MKAHWEACAEEVVQGAAAGPAGDVTCHGASPGVAALSSMQREVGVFFLATETVAGLCIFSMHVPCGTCWGGTWSAWGPPAAVPLPVRACPLGQGWRVGFLWAPEQQSQVREELACGCKWSFASTANVELQNKCSESCASPKH